MPHYRLALIGFGGVNRALAEIIRDQNEQAERAQGFSLGITAITDLALGTWIDDGGIDPADALRIPPDGSFAGRPGGSAEMDNRRAIRDSSADVIVEATYTDPVDGEPATSHVRWALEAGKHVITTNKGPVMHHAPELGALAEHREARFEYEGTVMSGTPVIRFARTLLVGNPVHGFEGILNGTSNYVLGRMAAGLTLAEALTEARRLGYAEQDPEADIDGADAQLKVAILASEVFGRRVGSEDVETRGITEISPSVIAAAEADGKVWKLIGRAAMGEDGSVRASVSPTALDSDHPLAGVSGATNAITFHTAYLGGVTISGPGAGRTETAYALLSDVVAIHAAVTRPAR